MSHVVDPSALRPHYASFLREGRVLLTGHSHQAWPDVAREGNVEAFEAAALHVDDKWGPAFEAAQAVRESVARTIGSQADRIALGGSTHELVVRVLSALPLGKKRHIVTTSGEFHTLHRQLSRLAEEGVEVTFVAPAPVDTLAARLADAVRADTAALFVSTVLFETSTLVPDLAACVARAREKGAEVVLDAYHHFLVKPFAEADVAGAFVVGGGYKYAQWGEGVCFLSVPAGTELRPVVTGWFSDFGSLAAPRDGRAVGYGPTLADRFAGSTYDPTSHFRARRVIRFFAEHGLDAASLAAGYALQTARISDALVEGGFDVVSPRDPARRGGFVAVRVDDPSAVVDGARRAGVFFDARGGVVRLGPAPYLRNDEIDHGIAVFRSLARPPAR